MDIKLHNEINRLVKTRDKYRHTYIQELKLIEEKFESTGCHIKKDILEKQRNIYQKRSSSMESTVKMLNKKIESIERVLKSIKKDKENFKFNIEKLRTGIVNKDTGEIFDMFSSVVNALEILNHGINEIDQKSEHSF